MWLVDSERELRLKIRLLNDRTRLVSRVLLNVFDATGRLECCLTQAPSHAVFRSPDH